MGTTPRHDPYELRSGTFQGAPESQTPESQTPESQKTPESQQIQQSPQDRRSAPVSVLLWTLVAVLAGVNTALSIAGYVIIGSVAGAGVVGLLVILLMRYLRARR